MPDIYTDVERALSRAGFRLTPRKIFDIDTNYMDGDLFIERKQKIILPSEFLMYDDKFVVSDSGKRHIIVENTVIEQGTQVEYGGKTITIGLDTRHITTLCTRGGQWHNWRAGWYPMKQAPRKYPVCKHCERKAAK